MKLVDFSIILNTILVLLFFLQIYEVNSFIPLILHQSNFATDLRSEHQLFYQRTLNEDGTSSHDNKFDQSAFVDTAELTVALRVPKVQRHFETYLWSHNGEEYHINFRAEGDLGNPPILLVHGFGANVGHFRHQYEPLSKAGFRVYAIDLLGFGASDKPEGVTYSIGLFANLINDFILAMSDNDYDNICKDASKRSCTVPWVVAGNSIGGLCSLAVAELQPDRIRGVILFNVSGGMNVFRYEDVPTIVRPILFFFQQFILGSKLGSYFFNRFKTRKNVEAILKSQGVYRDITKVDEELLETLLEPGSDEGAEAVFLKVFSGDPGPSPESILPNIDCPILTIWGGSDPWIPLDKGMHPATEFHKYVKNPEDFQLEVLPNAGHCPHDEASDEVNEKMIRWMTDLPKQMPDDAFGIQ